ncbi:hypothetical protein EUX98_g7549 [Antrodiella citrinella]|uniref:Glutaminase A central domain-containing protein n=1 Tax=Antrodiella citrinella TaxID=2447956 RepID=A0A4S4MLS8_9APHY|nr:hypothetical protein EUX98_g7549 [Antrodiella citrinella]
MISISLRQAFAVPEVTVSKNTDGSFNASDVLIFRKEISSSERANTVDMLYTMWPPSQVNILTHSVFMISVSIILRQGVTTTVGLSVRSQGSPAVYKNVAQGKDFAMPIEECGNMLVMVLSYTQHTGDHSLITTYFNLLGQWADYLVANALSPPDQLSSDAFAGSLVNQTNLAIKGIIGISGMSEIAKMSFATSYVSQFQTLAISTVGKHLTLSYGNDSRYV